MELRVLIDRALDANEQSLRFQIREMLPPRGSQQVHDAFVGWLPQDLAIAGGQLPPRYCRALAGYRHGPGVFKLDYALSEPVPWAAEEPRRAGTVHVGGAELAPSGANRVELGLDVREEMLAGPVA